MARVLHVVSYFPPDRIGGVGEVVAHVHRGLLARGHQSVVLSSGRRRADADVLRVADSPGGFVLGALRGLRAARQSDVVHIHHGEGALLLVMLRILGARTPILLTLHVSLDGLRGAAKPYVVAGRRLGGSGPGLLERMNLALRGWLDRIALRRADAVTFISHSAARDVLGAAQATTAQVIYNGVSAAQVSVSAPTGAAKPAAGGTTDVASRADLLFVGTNSSRKRVGLLPLVLAELRLRRPGATLRIVGLTSDDNPELVELARELGLLSQIEFVGRVRSDELGHYYRHAGVLLVPSAYEGLPMVILEAFLHGLPCVATNVSGHPEVIQDGENGVLVPLDDYGAMAHAALRILEDPMLRERMAVSAMHTVRERFSVDRQVNEYLKAYAQLGVAV